MPIFEYKCDQCDAEFEKLVFATDDMDIQCPDCKSIQVSKKMSATGLTGSTACSPGGSSGGGSPFS